MGYDFTSGLQITVSSIHCQSIWAYVSPLSVLRPGSVQVENFSAQVGNRTRAHGDESNPLEISMSSPKKGKPGLATGLIALGALHPFIRAWKSVTETCVKRGSNRGQGPIRFLLLYRGSSPFTHCATSAGDCATSAGFCATSAGSLRHQCLILIVGGGEPLFFPVCPNSLCSQ
jgi:hypothetical protein